MSKDKFIMWEKFEHYVNKHIGISKLLMTGSFIKPKEAVEKDNFVEEFEEEQEDDEQYAVMQFPITEDLLEGIKLTTNFECWLAHCNFPITNELVMKLNKTEGIEYLEILSKYRFLIGLGKAFTLKDVRANLQQDLGVTNNE